MGHVKIRGRDGEESSVHTRWEGTLVLELAAGEPRVVVSRDAPFDANAIEVTDDGDAERSPSLVAPWWLFIAPAVVGTLVTALVGAGAVDASFGVRAPVTAFVLGLLALLFGLTGTLLIYNDAAHLDTSDGHWRPNPWAYVGGGAAVLTAAYALASGLPKDPLAASWALVGVGLVAGLASSVIAGPLYLYIRWRRIGLA